VIIQFAHVDFVDLNLAKLQACLLESDPAHVDSVSKIADTIGLSADAIAQNHKMMALVGAWQDPSRRKSFRTPLADWDETPFLLDAEEKPMSVVNAWLRYVAKRSSPKTVRTYAYALFDFFQYIEARRIEWKDVDDDILFAYRRCQETVESAHKKRHKGTRKLARGTIQMRILTVAKFYKYAIRNGYIIGNRLTFELVQVFRPSDTNFLAHLGRREEREMPIAAYRRVSRRSRPKSLDHEKIWTWITSIAKERDRLISLLLYQTGMRREEIILWRVDEIPSSNYQPTASGVQFEIRGKGGKNRLIRISPGVFTQLRYWLDFLRPKIMKTRGISEDEDHGFVWIAERDGHPLQPISLNHIFTDISRRCGTDVTPHMLRHSFAREKRKELHEDGIANPEKILQLALGHSSVATTMGIYGDISPQDEAREADSNATLLAKLVAED